MSKLAVTIQVECLIPADEYDERLGEIVDGLERGLQQAEAEYLPIEIRRGISAEASDSEMAP
jgi:hypothetical protein